MFMARLLSRSTELLVGIYNVAATEILFLINRTKLRSVPIDESFPVVSLTSYGKRLCSARLTVMRLLLNQDLHSNIVLWVADSEFDVATSMYRGLICTRFTVKSTRDLRSYKKLVPAVESYGYEQSFLCLDDDVVLPISAPTKLISASKNHKGVLAGRCHEISYNPDGTVMKYLQWSHEHKCQSDELFFTGTGLVFYPPCSLVGLLDRFDTLVDLCPTSDDLVFNAVVRENGFPVYFVEVDWKPIYWLGSQKVSLTEVNVVDGANDIQIERLSGHFSNVKWLR